jgi:single-stranded-DNA-specific exonuclease
MSVLHQRVLKDKHLKLTVRPAQEPGSPPREAIWFHRSEPVPDVATVAYRLELNEWQGRTTVQMQVVAASP